MSPKIIAQRKEILTEDWRIKVAMDAERVYERVWESGTRSGHGAGLLRFTEYCESRGIPEIHRFPLTDELAVGFIGWAAGQLGPECGPHLACWLESLAHSPWLPVHRGGQCSHPHRKDSRRENGTSQIKAATTHASNNCPPGLTV